MYPTSFPELLQRFFAEHLLAQRQLSQQTIAAYRDTFRLLLRFAEKRVGRQPSDLLLTDIDAPFIGSFLSHLEQDRKSSARSRNARLSAIRSFFHFIAAREPAHSALIQRVLAMPQQRFDRDLVAFLTRPEIDALLAAPDKTTQLGRRDHALLVFAVQTGFRVSEITALRVEDLAFGVGAHAAVLAKVARSAARRSLLQPPPSFAPGSRRLTPQDPTWSSPANGVRDSAMTPCSGSSQSTPPSPRQTAPPWLANT